MAELVYALGLGSSGAIHEGSSPFIDTSSMSDYEFGGRPVTPINLLLLLGEMEGVYQHLKYMGFEEDMQVIDRMKKKYYSMYFKEKKKGD